MGRRRADPADRRSRRGGSGAKANPLVALRSWSARLYPEWTAALLEETGIDPGYRRTGGVNVAWTDREDEALRAAAGQWRAEGIAYERIPPGDYARVEPALNPELRSVYYLPDRAQVRNPRLLRALRRPPPAAGHPGAPPGRRGVRHRRRPDRVGAIRTRGDIPCGLVIVAAGAWSGGLLEPAGVRAPTPPLKGQIVLLKGDRPLLGRVVEHGKNYLVPRDDGRVLVGATEEDAGFDARPTALGRPRPARRGPAPLPDPGPRRRSRRPGPACARGASTPAPTSGRPPASRT